ncbi:LOW QUALITY PROTEIN: cilia- and flagella-associated protein 107 [Pleuronectes platessa]|uniref:LOW QUALITY PROTEIN: cilia- and flagella-associated protein 107 n=1 Tax=Pleuronectes platessa TaxID=8262 RepID=UPI00232A0DA8|nr:LOW QUALITY PROTEIN: cilia- and flagella-associated protein 107 [Pleuronectes platessa]
MKQRERLGEKWAQTGWRIEQKYGNKVLVGNWAEERLQFTREPETAKSTNRADYRPHWDFRPDVSQRGCALLRAEGLPYKQLFGHRRPASSHYLVTQYEDSYGREHTPTLPSLQPRSPGGSTRQPERSDQPIPDLPTDSGLPWSARRRVEKQRRPPPSMTVYRSAYQSHPLRAFCQSRFARASCALSSHLHPANHDNKDLDLRRRSLLQVPDPGLSRPQP